MAEDRTVTIPEWSVNALTRAVRSLARAARRAGIEEPTLSVNHATRRELRQTQENIYVIEGSVEGVSAKTSVVPVVDCTIHLPDGGRFGVPGGWRVLATLERVETVEPTPAAAQNLTNEIFTSASDLPRAEAYRHTELTCEHCKARRVRTKTLVLEDSATGALKQVGKECATFYVGDRADQMIRELEFRDFVATVLKPFEESNPERGFGFGGGLLCAWDAEEVVAHAAACVREHGWEPSTTRIPGAWEERYEPNPNATWRQVSLMLTHMERWQAERAAADTDLARHESALAELRDNTDPASVACVKVIERQIERLKERKWPTPPYTITEADRARGREVLAWLNAQQPEPSDNYTASLKAAFSPGWVSERKLAFAVSVVRACERAAEIAEERRLSALSQHVGAVGQRLDLTLTLTRAIPYGGPFPGTVYVFRDGAGNSFSWKTSAGYMGSGDVGRTFVFKATIKEHGEFKGTKTTELSRVKIIEEKKSADANTEALPDPQSKPSTNGLAH